MSVRVRFAPSPTGFLHIGSVRTALYNWLFARHNAGVFILRIEDTDELRSTEESVNTILEGMKWLGLDWDEGPGVGGDYGPYFQMERLHIYKKYAEQLIKQDKAYYCYCAPEELALRRQEAIDQKRPPKYNGQCKELTEAKEIEYNKQKRKPVVRFKMPDVGKTIINDLIRGKIEFDNTVLDDFVLLKSNGIPIYNFANVIDDSLMEITHIIRGDDHISNTPRQILLYEALGFKAPAFAHVPMIHGSDGTRLSKRHGATAVSQYKEEGYLPEALRNYLVLLGWSTSDSQQIFSLQEMIDKFSLEGCGRSAAIFDAQKLLWMNGEYIRNTDIDTIVNLSLPYLEKNNLLKAKPSQQYLKKIISLEHDKIKLISDVPHLVDFFLLEEINFDEKAVEKILKKDYVPNMLELIKKRLNSIDEADFEAKKLEKLIRQIAEELNLKTSEVFHPIRVSISGRTTGPGLFEMMEVLGKQKLLKRIEKVLKEIV